VKIRSAQKLGASVVIVSDYSNDSHREDQDFKKDLQREGLLEGHIPLFEISFADAAKI
jgi:hypothetical protein